MNKFLFDDLIDIIDEDTVKQNDDGTWEVKET